MKLLDQRTKLLPLANFLWWGNSFFLFIIPVLFPSAPWLEARWLFTLTSTSWWCHQWSFREPSRVAGGERCLVHLPLLGCRTQLISFFSSVYSLPCTHLFSYSVAYRGGLRINIFKAPAEQNDATQYSGTVCPPFPPLSAWWPVSHSLSFSLCPQKGDCQAPNRKGFCAAPFPPPSLQGSLPPLTCSLNAGNLLIYSSTHSIKIPKSLKKKFWHKLVWWQNLAWTNVRLFTA